jgi:hypothetical protein
MQPLYLDKKSCSTGTKYWYELRITNFAVCTGMGIIHFAKSELGCGKKIHGYSMKIEELMYWNLETPNTGMISNFGLLIYENGIFC